MKDSFIKVAKVALVAFFIYISLDTIIRSPHPLSTAITTVIIWLIVYIVVRNRKAIGGFLESDIPLKNYIEQRREEKHNAVVNVTQLPYMHPEVGSHESAELSDKEQQEWERIQKQFTDDI